MVVTDEVGYELSRDHFTKICVHLKKEFKLLPKSNGKSSNSFISLSQMTFLSALFANHLHGLIPDSKPHQH